MQQPPQMIPMMASFPPTNITTEQIQGVYLDENKRLILAIWDNQNLGKLAECAQCKWGCFLFRKLEKKGLMTYGLVLKSNLDKGSAWLLLYRYQTQLQKNLMYLAAIADAQPQTPAMPQMAPHPAMQQGTYYIQHPQAAAMAQQPGIFPPKMPLQFNAVHQMQDPQLLHQQAMQGQMGIRPIGANSGTHPMRAEIALGSSGHSASAGTNDMCGGSKQHDSGAATTGGADAQGGSAARHNGDDGSEDAK
ncbi:hypothetical protein POTOM_008532 [Populus tomentosa]|uniref:SS18 N-terminal domain-containing protein n=1 Tax=Populus tomentosa TaxID=118781 RepID=A0A8X8AHN9_POPTO|nr:hypothetical protein POTOM_008532 [Populus tomentosa]